MLVNISLDDAYFLGVLSSRIHVGWTLAAGGTLENRPRYTKTTCFDPFPFPEPSAAQKKIIRKLAEELDRHRSDVLAKHPQLTMTKLYNVMEKTRTGQTLTDAENDVYEAGLVGVLKSLHNDIDASVAEAYGWPANLTDDEIFERLVELNRQRTEEEQRGEIRWLRPEYQAAEAAKRSEKAKQIEADLLIKDEKKGKPRLPAELPEQMAALRAVLANEPDAITTLELSRRFSQGKRVEKRVAELLRTLALLGQVQRTGDTYFLSE